MAKKHEKLTAVQKAVLCLPPPGEKVLSLLHFVLEQAYKEGLAAKAVVCVPSGNCEEYVVKGLHLISEEFSAEREDVFYLVSQLACALGNIDGVARLKRKRKQ